MSQIDEIKDRLNIVDVVSGYVKLDKAGKSYKGISPFTNEKTPSFFVSPEKNMFYCFSSNKGGDIFTFIQEMERVDFFGALKILAERAGVELKKVDPEKKNEKDRLYEVVEAATRFYQQQFVGNEQAFSYMVSRGVKSSTLKAFRVGFAPNEWEKLSNFLKSEGFSEKEMVDAGLTISRGEEKEGSYDRFRGRIMFPLCDQAGRVVGFSGRVFSGDESSAKYINTPETPLYHKSNLLYGFDKAKEVIRKKDAVILVEGQMDVLASYQAGVENVVAVSGTSLTMEHLKILARFTDNLSLALDSDHAGQNASDKSARTALLLGINVFVVALPPGTDPADIVKEDGEKWKEFIQKPEEYIPFRISRISQEITGDPSEVIKETIFPHVKATKGSIRQDRVISDIAGAIGRSVESVRDEYEQWLKMHQEEVNEENIHGAVTPESGQFQKRKGTRREMVERRLIGLIEWQKATDQSEIDVLEAKKGYNALFGEEGEREKMMSGLDSDELGKLALEAEFLYGESEDIEVEGKTLQKSLEIELITEELQKLSRDIQKSDSQGGENLESILKKYQALLSRKEVLRREVEVE